MSVHWDCADVAKCAKQALKAKGFQEVSLSSDGAKVKKPGFMVNELGDRVDVNYCGPSGPEGGSDRELEMHELYLACLRGELTECKISIGNPARLGFSRVVITPK